MGAVGEIAGSGIVKLKQSIRSILPDDIVMWMKAGFDYGNNRKMLRKKETMQKLPFVTSGAMQMMILKSRIKPLRFQKMS